MVHHASIQQFTKTLAHLRPDRPPDSQSKSDTFCHQSAPICQSRFSLMRPWACPTFGGIRHNGTCSISCSLGEHQRRGLHALEVFHGNVVTLYLLEHCRRPML